MSQEGRRVAYDRFWGVLLLSTAFLPYRLDGASYPWQLFPRVGAGPQAWLVLGTVTGLLAVVVGFLGWRKRRRHLLNFFLGAATVALPLAWPGIWQMFPHANPAALPLGDVGSVGWVMLVSLTAIYAGSGIRIVRPSQVAGQALGPLGALILAVFAFLPGEESETSVAFERFRLLADVHANWRALAPFLLILGAAICAILNLVRSQAEVWLARLTRILLVGGMFVWLALPFLEEDSQDLQRHMPYAWGGIRLLAPLFLSLDAATAFLAMSITRSND